MNRLRVLVVEDSLTVRERLCEVLREADMHVVGEAQDGREAVAMCQSLRPDVITMDMALPAMSGLAATEYIMAHCPTPILIVSASFNRGDVFKTYDALAAGAVDVIEKPTGREAVGVWEATFLSAIRVVSRVRVITRPRGRVARSSSPPMAAPPSSSASARLVAIGASTGGPSALVTVLRALPAHFDLPVLIVLHLGAAFAQSFAEWLDAQLQRPVRFAAEGELVASLRGQVRLAPPDRHLVMRDGQLRLTQTPERFSCRPSVDVLFESLAHETPTQTVACLLTGMGRDGAAGLLALREAGATTIAQDEESCAVYGMPREAAEIGAAQRILPLSSIGPALAQRGEKR